MSNLVRNIFIMIVVYMPYSLYAATAYETDVVDYYVSDNAANEALSEVNFIMCMMAAMGADKMVNRGPYKVSLYEDDCKAADTSSSDAAAAKPKSAKTNQNEKKSSTTTTQTTAKAVTVGYADVTRADDSSSQIAKGWLILESELEEWCENMPAAQREQMGAQCYTPEILVYTKITTTAAPSATSQFGEFDMQMAFALNAEVDHCPAELNLTPEQKLAQNCLMPIGTTVGGGRILASGSEVSYIDYRINEPPLRTILSYNGDKVEGITVDSQGFLTGDDWVQMKITRAFNIDNGDAAIYCSKVISAASLDFENYILTDGYNFPTATDVTLPHSTSGLTTDETCFSLKESDAQKNIHRYGVYKSDGTRATLSGVPGFPMHATVKDSDNNDLEIHGYADYWGVHVDDQAAGLWDGDTIFTREQFAAETGPALTVKIAQANQRVTKYTKSYLALNDLDKLTVNTWINGTDDTFGAAYATLGFPAGVEAEFEGTYDKGNGAAGDGSWKFTKQISHTDGYNVTTLGTPITFTNTEYVNKMTVDNEGSYVFKVAPMNGLQLSSTRLKLTDYLQGDSLSASAAENITYLWISGAPDTGDGNVVRSDHMGMDSQNAPDSSGLGIDLENLEGLINGAANARPLKLKGYFGNVPYAASGTTTMTVTLTQGNDGNRTGTDDQISGSVPVAWTSDGTTMTFTIAAGTTLSGIYNDGGTAVNFNIVTNTAHSKSITMDSTGKAVFELILGDELKSVKNYTSNFANFFSNAYRFNMTVDFGALNVYTYGDQSQAADKFSFTTNAISNADVNTADTWTQSRGFWGWSPDTGNGYDIGISTLQNPADATSTNGISVEEREELTPANYPDKLKCIFSCPTAATIMATANASMALTDPAIVVNPFVPATVQYLKSGSRAGDYGPGVLATDIQTYTTSGLSVLDSTSAAMGFDIGITEEGVQYASYVNIPNDNWSNEIKDGIHTGRLLGGTDAEIASQLATLECERADNTKTVSATNAYRDEHPVFSATALRYCEDAYWKGTGPTTWYGVSFGVRSWDRKRFAVDQSINDYVDFSRPETLYYQVPNDATAYPKDAGKSVRLTFGGFGQLWGIPGNVINVTTGKVLGDHYSGEWGEHLRYVQRFALEPYNGVDPVLTSKGSAVTYKVKALEGEQWLLKKDAAIDSLTYTKSAADLPAYSSIVLTGPKTVTGEDNPTSIGAVPAASTLFNDGKPSVIHGELTVTF